MLLLLMFPAWCAAGEPPVTALALSPDHHQFVTGSQAGASVHNWQDLAPVGSLTVGMSAVHDLRFSPDGTQLLVAGGDAAESGVVETFSWPERTRTCAMSSHSDVVSRAAWSPDQRFFATASADGSCCVVNVTNGTIRIRYTGHSQAVHAIIWLDPQTLASCGADQTVRIWSVDGNHKRTLDNHVAAVNDLAVRPAVTAEPALLATASDDRTVRFWNPQTGRMIRFVRFPSPVLSICWSDNGEWLVAGCQDGICRKIPANEPNSGTDLQHLDGPVYVVLANSGIGQVLAGGSAGLQRFPDVPNP